MHRLVWASACRTYHIVGNLMSRLICRTILMNLMKWDGCFENQQNMFQSSNCDTLKLCCRGLCVPWYLQGRQFGWGLKSGTCIGQNYSFFWLSINYASNFPIILSFSYAVTPPPPPPCYSSQVWQQRVWCRCRYYSVSRTLVTPVFC